MMFANGLGPGLRSLDVLLPSSVAHRSSHSMENQHQSTVLWSRHLTALRQSRNLTTASQGVTSLRSTPADAAAANSTLVDEDDVSLWEDDEVPVTTSSSSSLVQSVLRDKTGLAFLKTTPERSSASSVPCPSVKTTTPNASVSDIHNRVLLAVKVSPYGPTRTLRQIHTALSENSTELTVANESVFMNAEACALLLAQVSRSLAEAQKRSVGVFVGHLATPAWQEVLSFRDQRQQTVDATSSWRQRVVALVGTGYDLCHQLWASSSTSSSWTPPVAREALRFYALCGDDAKAWAVLERQGALLTATDVALAKAACCYAESFARCEAIHHQFAVTSNGAEHPLVQDVAHLTVLANSVGRNSVDCVRVLDEFQRLLQDTAAGVHVPPPILANCASACCMAIAQAIPRSERQPLSIALFKSLLDHTPTAVSQDESLAEAMLVVLSSVGARDKTSLLRARLRSRPLSTYAAVCVAAEPPIEELIELFRDTRQEFHSSMVTAASVRLVGAVHAQQSGALSDQFALWSLQGPGHRVASEGMLDALLTSIVLHLDSRMPNCGPSEVEAAMTETLRMLRETQEWYHTRTVSVASLSAMIRLRVIAHMLGNGLPESLLGLFDNALCEGSAGRFTTASNWYEKVITVSEWQSLTSLSSSTSSPQVVMLNDGLLVALAEYVSCGDRDCRVVVEALQSVTQRVQSTLAENSCSSTILTVDQFALLNHVLESLAAVRHGSLQQLRKGFRDLKILVADGAASSSVRLMQQSPSPSSCLVQVVDLRLHPAVESLRMATENQQQKDSPVLSPSLMCSPRHMFQPKTALEVAMPWLLTEPPQTSKKNEHEPQSKYVVL